MDRRPARPLIAPVAAILLALASACVLQYTVPLEGDLGCDGDEVVCGALCIDLTDDRDHCGACGRACAADETCVAAACVPACAADEVCDGFCVELDRDPANCGACRRWCDSDEICEAGECVRACDQSCEDEAVCVAGACQCREGFVACNGKCVDLVTDESNCGECDRGCDGQPCGGGECQPDDCGDWPDHCDKACTDVGSDPLHCGSCNRACHPSQRCEDGECVAGA
jgi:hypothetical protein